MKKSSTQLEMSPLQRLRQLTVAQRAMMRASVVMNTDTDPIVREDIVRLLDRIEAEQVENTIDRAFMQAHQLIQVARKRALPA